MDIARLYTPASLRIRIRLDERIDKGRVAQLGEHRPYKPGVTGSIPVPPTIFFEIDGPLNISGKGCRPVYEMPFQKRWAVKEF